MDPVSQSFVDLAKYGTTGVMLALIMLVAGALYAMWKLASNHITHSNDIFRENTKALTELTGAIKDINR